VEKQWFYTQGRSDQQGPVSGEQIREMISRGDLKKRDLLWCEGMPEWVRVEKIPEFNPTPAPATPATPAEPMAAGTLPASLPGWMGFVGVINIIYGVFACLTCIGALVGIPIIIGGSALLAARKALAEVGELSPSLTFFFKKLHTFLVALGILYIIGLLVLAAEIIFLAAMMYG
jgi:hypothetical protein